MGFDLYGRHPRTRTGRYFRVHAFWWGPLWAFTCTLAADVLSKEATFNGFLNEGQYITAAQAREIAARLDGALRDGSVARHARKLRGRRFDEALVRTFKNFCRSSGGFAIR
jgi:hypothetical protein